MSVGVGAGFGIRPDAAAASCGAASGADLDAAGCVVCHDFTARTVPFASRAAAGQNGGHATPFTGRAGVKVCPEFANESSEGGWPAAAAERDAGRRRELSRSRSR